MRRRASGEAEFMERSWQEAECCASSLKYCLRLVVVAPLWNAVTAECAQNGVWPSVSYGVNTLGEKKTPHQCHQMSSHEYLDSSEVPCPQVHRLNQCETPGCSGRRGPFLNHSLNCCCSTAAAAAASPSHQFHIRRQRCTLTRDVKYFCVLHHRRSPRSFMQLGWNWDVGHVLSLVFVDPQGHMVSLDLKSRIWQMTFYFIYLFWRFFFHIFSVFDFNIFEIQCHFWHFFIFQFFRDIFNKTKR